MPFDCWLGHRKSDAVSMQSNTTSRFSRPFVPRLPHRFTTVAGDMIATEAKYHPGCLLSLNHRASLMQSCGSEDTDADASGITMPNSESLALAEVIAYIEDTNFSGETPSVFKLTELGNFYIELLQKHGVNLHAKLNISRFKDRPLAACPDLTAAAHFAVKQMTENLLRHPLTQETAVPVYLGVMIHSSTRNKKIADKCHKIDILRSKKVFWLTKPCAFCVINMTISSIMILNQF